MSRASTQPALFALLEHRTGCAGQTAAPHAAGVRNVHWDLLIEAAGQARLPTWRLRDNPIGRAGEIAAERIADHRRVYLDYEGALSGGRGFVRRCDRGEAVVRRLAGDEAYVELRGDHLRGTYEIVQTDEGRLVFRAANESDWEPGRARA